MCRRFSEASSCLRICFADRPVSRRRHREEDLGREYERARGHSRRGSRPTPPRRRRPVDVRGVEEVDAGVECRLRAGLGVLALHAAGVGQPGPERDLRDLELGVAKSSCLHASGFCLTPINGLSTFRHDHQTPHGARGRQRGHAAAAQTSTAPAASTPKSLASSRWRSAPAAFGTRSAPPSSPSSPRAARRRVSTPRWAGRSTPRGDGGGSASAASSSRRDAGHADRDGSWRSRATIRARAGAASARCGFATARACRHRPAALAEVTGRARGA